MYIIDKGVVMRVGCAIWGKGGLAMPRRETVALLGLKRLLPADEAEHLDKKTLGQTGPQAILGYDRFLVDR